MSAGTGARSPSVLVRVDELSSRQIAALKSLAAGADLAEAAAAARVTVRTLRRWRSLPTWKAAYAAEIRAIGSDTKSAVVAASAEAARTLVNLMRNGTPTVRLRAAQTLLSVTLDILDDDVSERLDRLEEAAKSWATIG